MTTRSIGVAAVLGLALAACEGRPRSTPPSPALEASAPAYAGPSIAEIDLTRGAPERTPSTWLGSSGRHTYADLVRSIERLDAHDTKAVLVKLGTSSMGFARAEEIGTLLARAKKDMPVVCHADGYDNASIALASRGCSKIWLSESGSVESIGVAFQLYYANKLLTKNKVGVDFLQIGKFKGAEEPFTRDGPSPEARESYETALRGIRGAWLAAIAEGRGAPAAAAVEDGPYAAEEAKAKGLVDELGYYDDAVEAVKKEAGTKEIADRFGGHDDAAGARGVAGIVRALSGAGSISGPHVAIVPATGEITMASGGGLLPFGSSSGITERDLGRLIQRLTKSTSVKAVVLRIDSPGGSALASDLLWKRLMKLRAEKPIVVSVGGMAASGGYYLASTGSKIVAEPSSIVGSIGVVAGKIALGPALEEYGVHFETIAAEPSKAARATYGSVISPWDDATRARLKATMTSVYELFLKRVAEGRGTTPDKIASSAEGRLFGGVDAKTRGLVDELGGLSDAVKLARELAKLADDVPAEVVGDSGGLLDILDGRPEDEDGEAASRVARSIRPDPLGEMLARSPEIAAFLGSLGPLTTGEHTLAAVPFAVVLR